MAACRRTVWGRRQGRRHWVSDVRLFGYCWHMVSRDGSGPEAGRTPASDEVVALDQLFAEDGLPGLRTAVASHAADLGADRHCAGYLTVIANELATNAIVHGGGEGRLRLWRTGSMIFCQVVDTGPGLPDAPTAGLRRPGLDERTGRGLWLVRQMSDQLEARAGPPGTTITAGVRINTPQR